MNDHFICKGCLYPFRKKAYSKVLVDLCLCPQCYTKKSTEPSKCNKDPKVGLGVFIFKDQKILLGKRLSKTHGNNEWSLPGGHLEWFESFHDCCKREVYEETNLKIKNIELVYTTNDIFKEEDLHYITIYFSSDYESGNLIVKEPDKCERWLWYSTYLLPTPLFVGTAKALQFIKERK